MRYIKTYEVGDVVWVKKCLEVNEMYGVAYFSHPMQGIDVVTIEHIEFDGEIPTYLVKEVDGAWYTNEMLADILTKEEELSRRCPFKIGDVVRVTNTSDTQFSHLYNNRGVVIAIGGSDYKNFLIDFGYCYDCLHKGGGGHGLQQNSGFWFTVRDIELVDRKVPNECEL